MEPYIGFRGDAADFFQRLDRADFIVRVHHGEQNRFRPQRAAHAGGVHDSRAVDWQECDFNATLRQRLAWIQRRAMLDLRGDDVLAFAGRGAGHTENCEIV